MLDFHRYGRKSSTIFVSCKFPSVWTENRVTGQLADTPTRGLPTRGLDDSRTGHLSDWPTRGLDNSRTGQLAVSQMPPNRKTLVQSAS